MKKEKITLTLLTLMILTVVPMITAMGASIPYWKDNPLKLSPGETELITINLQNMVGTEDATLRVTLEKDGEGIAELLDQNTDYNVPIGRDDIEVPIRISIPETETLGGTRNIVISLREVTTGEGMVEVSSASQHRIPVYIVGEEESKQYQPEEQEQQSMATYLYILIGLVIILIIATYLTKNKPKTATKKKK